MTTVVSVPTLLWPTVCIADPTHFFIGTRRMDGGTFWLCKYCNRAKWLPDHDTMGLPFQVNIHRLGIQVAYWTMLSDYREVRRILCILYSLYGVDGSSAEYKETVGKYLTAH